MKKILFPFFILGFFCLPSHSLKAQNAPVSYSLENLASTLSTPLHLTRWMKENIRFEEDSNLFSREDYWQSPEEFLNHKEGDCEDYALFAQYVLERQGLEAYVVSLYGASGYAHTVLIYKGKKGYDVINQDKLISCEAQTVENALSKIYPDWTWAGVAENRNNRGWLVLEIENKP